MHIFAPQYQGSVESLILRHDCTGKMPSESLIPWLPRFVEDVLSGLDHLHRKGILHGNIKPDNIYYDEHSGRKSFYLANFRLAGSLSSEELGGTWQYLAPETTRNHPDRPSEVSTQSDIYAFGMTLLEVTGKFCDRECDLSVEDWQNKLEANGASGYREYHDEFPVKDLHINEIWLQINHSRVKSLCDYELLGSSFRAVLEQDPKRRATASKALGDFQKDYMDIASRG